MKLKSTGAPSIFTICAALSIVIPPALITSPPSVPSVLRRIAFTLATRIFGLNGLEIYSSTPSSKPWSSSLSSERAVSMMIGTLEDSLISRHTCHPSIFGIMTSRMIRAMSLSS